MQLLKELAPAARRLLVLNPGNPNSTVLLPAIAKVAGSFALEMTTATVAAPAEIERAIEKTRNELKSLQAERKAAYDAAQQEAILLTQLAHAKGQPPDQAKEFPSPELCGGFVYSLPEIARLIGRAARLAEANARFGTA